MFFVFQVTRLRTHFQKHHTFERPTGSTEIETDEYEGGQEKSQQV